MIRSCPGGTNDNSPAFQRWVCTPEGISPEGTAENRWLSRPSGTQCQLASIPALKRWAILNYPFGMANLHPKPSLVLQPFKRFLGSLGMLRLYGRGNFLHSHLRFGAHAGIIQQGQGKLQGFRVSGSSERAQNQS